MLSDIQIDDKWNAQNTLVLMDTRIVWVDLEMTGLDCDKDAIIEIACIITDGDLNIVATSPDLVINQSKDVMDNMAEWCTEHHGKSGLTEQVLQSKISLQDAEDIIYNFVCQYTAKGVCPLAGNSIHVDKQFLEKQMPSVIRHLHYRIIDVSTIKELCRRWYPLEYSKCPRKKMLHRALDDINESIDELKFYRRTIFKTDGVTYESGIF